jgi:hypothetical protein
MILQAKASQYMRLQLLSLAISVIGLILQSTTVAVVMLIVGTVFGMLASYARIQEAKEINQRGNRSRRR